MIENETDEAAARREAGEELGVSLHALERVARIWSSPGVTLNGSHYFWQHILSPTALPRVEEYPVSMKGSLSSSARS